MQWSASDFSSDDARLWPMKNPGHDADCSTTWVPVSILSVTG
jgi:hypothetical protein